MSSTIGVKFFSSKDTPKYKKYRAVLESCFNAGVDIPEDVINYFNLQGYSLDYVKENLEECIGSGVRKEVAYDYDYNESKITIKTKDIPNEIDLIEFKISY